MKALKFETLLTYIWLSPFFPLDAFKIFSVTGFRQFDYDVPWCVFFFTLLCFVVH